MTIFVIEDEMHDERFGEFATSAEAWAALRQLVTSPFDQEPNLPPCSKGAACRRTYEIAEYDNAKEPWSQLSRTLAVELSANGTIWKVALPGHQ